MLDLWVDRRLWKALLAGDLAAPAVVDVLFRPSVEMLADLRKVEVGDLGRNALNWINRAIDHCPWEGR